MPRYFVNVIEMLEDGPVVDGTKLYEEGMKLEGFSKDVHGVVHVPTNGKLLVFTKEEKPYRLIQRKSMGRDPQKIQAVQEYLKRPAIQL